MYSDEFLLVIFGICFVGVDVGDQKRVMILVDVIDVGVSYLVMGCLIMQVENLFVVLQVVNQSLI